MNYTSFIIKILTKPKKSSFENGISVTELMGKFFQFKTNTETICKLSIWGNLAHDSIQYYDVNDYLIVEGYISLRTLDFEEFEQITPVEISVFKIYPFSLDKLHLEKVNNEVF